MWFKNIIVYRFNEPVTLSAEAVDQALAQKPFAPIGQMQETSFGWVPPFKDSEMFAEAVNGRIFLTAQMQEKLLPASVVNEHLIEKIDAIEEAEGRRPSKKEREQLKEDLRSLLLPKAFHKTKRISAWIDTRQQRLVVNASSDKSADDFTAHLREALGSLNIVPLGKSGSAAELLTQWYHEPEQRPMGTSIEADLELAMAQDSTVKARYKNLALESPEIQHSLDSGMRIIQMALAFEDRLQLVINDKLQLKRLKYQEKLIEQAGDSDDPRTDAILMSDTVSEWLSLLEAQVLERQAAAV